MQRVTHNSKALIAALCLLAQGMSLGHHLLVEHTRCAEHGELVHANDHADHHATTAQADAPHAAVDATEADHEADHDHCAVASDRRKAIRSVAPVRAAVAFEVSAPTVLVSQGLVARRAVHWIAPKTSPPV